MTKKMVSIVVINYNTFQLTSECIQSIYDFTSQIDYEIILVDNASDECDADLFLREFPNIKLIKSKSNVGFAKGNNLGIAAATGKYILLLNSDVLLLENSIQKCVELLEEDQTIGVMSPKLVYPDGTPQPVANRFPSIFNMLLYLTRSFKLLPPQTREKVLLGDFVGHKSILEVDWVTGAFFITRKEVITQLNEKKLSDHFFMYYEDVEWCFDIKQLGYKIIYNPFTKAIHYGSISFNKNNSTQIDKKIKLIANNEKTFITKTKGWAYHKIYRFICLLINLSVKNTEYAKLNFNILVGRH